MGRRSAPNGQGKTPQPDAPRELAAVGFLGAETVLKMQMAAGRPEAMREGGFDGAEIVGKQNVGPNCGQDPAYKGNVPGHDPATFGEAFGDQVHPTGKAQGIDSIEAPVGCHQPMIDGRSKPIDEPRHPVCWPPTAKVENTCRRRRRPIA